MEKQFVLTSDPDSASTPSGIKKTVTYDLGGGPLPCESSFYAAGYGDTIAIEHHTLKYFGLKHVDVANVVVNGATFTTAEDAVAAINSLDIWVENEGGGSGGGGIPEAPLDGKQYGRQSGTWTETTGGGGGGIPEAPEDGKTYGRKDGAWSEVSGGSGGGTAADVTVDNSGFENLTGSNVQEVLNDIDNKIGQGGGNTVTYDADGNVMAGETLIASFQDGEETFGNELTHTSIASFDRPEVRNPSPGIKQVIANPDLLSWSNGNADFKDPSPRGWRIPTLAEMQALDAAGRGAWTQLNNVNGRYLGGGENIFFPAAGRVNPSAGQGETAYYWTADARSEVLGQRMTFGRISVSFAGASNELLYPVRCVRDASVTDFEPCPTGEFQVGDIVWAKSNLIDVAKFAPTAESFGAYFQWGQNVAIGGDGEPLDIRHQLAYLSDVSRPTAPLTVRITNMLNIQSPAMFIAELHRPAEGEGTDSEIVLHGDDTTGVEGNDLTITIPFGYGAARFKTFPGVTDIDTGNVDSEGKPIFDRQYWTAWITAESSSAQSQLFIPKEAQQFDGFWMVGSAQTALSYWSDLDGTQTPYDFANTPMDSFRPQWSQDPVGMAVQIEGKTVLANDISELVFGEDYDSVTSIDDAVFQNFDNIRKLQLPRNIASIGEQNVYNLSNLTDFDLPPKLESIGVSAIYLIPITKLTIPQTLTSIGDTSLQHLEYLEDIQIGSFDISKCTIGYRAFRYVGAAISTPKVIRADSLALGEAFKAAFGTTFDGWEIIVNS